MKTFRCVPAVAATALFFALPLAGTGSPGPSLEIVRQLNESFVDIAGKVSPSVVVITVDQKESPVDFGDLDEDQNDSKPPGFWKRFHEQFKHPPLEKTIGQGSGIIVRENGYILTNGHVIEDAESIKVRLQNGKTYPATVRGVDTRSDVAVIKIDAHGLAAADLADSSKTRVGEFAIAIGAPFGFDYSVTFGHVSAKSRSHIIEGLEGMSMDQDFIQTDALISPGNSGGPLVNIEGQVIGINTLIQGLHSGIGFAIPSSLAKEVSDQLIETGRFTRPYLGIEMKDVREEPALHDFISEIQEGVVVERIVKEGPAAKSELKPIDVITAVDGESVTTPQQFRGIVRGKKIGAPMTLQVFRDGKTIAIKVSPIEWPETLTSVTDAKPAPAPKAISVPKAVPVDLGITVKPLTASLASQLGTAAAAGVVVATVERNSPAARSGVKPGEIITSINQQTITTRKEFQAAVEKSNLKKGVLVTLLSANSARYEILKAAP